MSPIVTLATLGAVASAIACHYYTLYRAERNRAIGWLECLEWRKASDKKRRTRTGQFKPSE
jgi:hypothetical protein